MLQVATTPELLRPYNESQGPPRQPWEADPGTLARRNRALALRSSYGVHASEDMTKCPSSAELPARQPSTTAEQARRFIEFSDCELSRLRFGPMPHAPQVPAASQLGVPGRRCMGLGSKRQAKVRLLIGVIVGPYDVSRREAIRSTWKRWAYGYDDVLVCFVIGLEGVPTSQVTALKVEARHRQQHDLLLLPNAPDACVLSLKKLHEWWRAAARTTSLPSNASNAAVDQSTALASAGSAADDTVYVAKVDDDSFIHIPNLLNELSRVSCVGPLHLGAIAWAGYHPTLRQLCGFSWGGRGAYDRYGCASRGAHPPFPFSLGGLQVLSLSVVRSLVSSERVRQFVAGFDASRAEALKRGEQGAALKSGDDVVLGYWINDLRKQQQVQVANGGGNGMDTLVARLPKPLSHVSLKKKIHDVSCDHHTGFFRPPQRGNVMMHHAKTPQTMAYIWQVLGEGYAHSKKVCIKVQGSVSANDTLQHSHPDKIAKCMRRVQQAREQEKE